jgi:hypothetical protein
MTRVFDKIIDRLPALLLLAILLLLAHVAIFDRHEPGRLMAGIPAALLLILYLRAGSGAGGGGKKAKAAE